MEAPGVLGGLYAVRFPGCDLSLRARLVRLVWRPGGAPGLYLGCEFLEPLDERRLTRLGVSIRSFPPETGVDTPSASGMRFRADPSRPLTLAVLSADGRPAEQGSLLGVHGPALATRFAPADPTDVVTRLSRKAHRISVAGPEGPLWEAEAYLLAVRTLEDRPDGVEVVFSASSAPGASVTNRMGRRE
jgi:hypothetical protein